MPIREAAKGFLISLKASNRSSAGYLNNLESSLALLSEFAEEYGWPNIHDVGTGRIEDYLLGLQTRPRWIGDRDKGGPLLSQSYIETQYRRLKRFFGWLVSREHIEANPLDLIPHPHIDERTIATVSEREIEALFRLLDPKKCSIPAAKFRNLRDRVVLSMLWDTPGRRNEIATLKIEGIDLDGGAITVMGKGRTERWMPIGSVITESLWEYMRVRAEIQP